MWYGVPRFRDLLKETVRVTAWQAYTAIVERVFRAPKKAEERSDAPRP